MEQNRSLLRALLRVLLRTQTELASKEKKFKALAEKSLEVASLTTPEGKLLYASEALTNVLGYSTEEILKMSVYELVHPNDIHGLVEARKEILQIPGKSFFRQQQLRHKNGAWIWFEGTVTNMMNEPGINALVSNFREVTIRKAAMEKLEQSENRFWEFFENAPEGITILDLESMTFSNCNGNAERILKYRKEELLSKGPLEISPERQMDGSKSAERARELIKKAVNGEKPVFEWLMLDAENNTVLCEVRVAVSLGSGKPELYLSFIDISERKRIEEKLRTQNRMLLQIASLQSHQVRAPIASILGLISLFDFNDLNSPINAEVLLRVQKSSIAFDKIIKKIVVSTSEIEQGDDDIISKEQ